MTDATFTGDPEGATAAQVDPSEKFTEGLAAKIGRGKPPGEAPVPQPQTKEEHAAIAPGGKWRDPTGAERIKPYEPINADDFATVPEGADWVDPEGQLHTKPRFEGIGFTAQAMYSMALDDDAREQVLRKVYGNKVKQGPEGLYIEDDNGVFRKPGAGGLSSKMGMAAAETAPAVGMAAGGLLGGAAGSIEPGAGTVAGATAGVMLGAAAGRQFNNVMLSMAGIHQSLGETTQSMAWEAAGAGGGEVLGRVASKIPGALRTADKAMGTIGETMSGITTGLADVLESVGVTAERGRKMFGTTQEAAQQAQRITAKGGKVGPGTLMPEAPLLKKIQEFDAVFRGRNVFGEAARDYYEQESQALANDLGVKTGSTFTGATARPSSKNAGEKILAAAQRDAAYDDARLEQARREAQQVLRAPIDTMGGDKAVRELHKQALTKLTKAVEDSSKASGNLIEAAIGDLRNDVTQMLTMTEKGENPSALVRMIDEKFRGYNTAIRVKARELYDAGSDAAAGAPMPNVDSLYADAQGFFNNLPEAVRSKYPSDVAAIKRLADQAENTAQGEIANTLSWGDLRQMRSWLRHGIDYNDLTPDMRAGSLKLFEKKINSVLHDANAHPQLKEATRLLDVADAYYKKYIPFMNDEMVNTTVQSLKSGAGINPEAAAKVFFDPARTEALRKARGIMGENLWKSVEAARINHMLDSSRMLDGKVNSVDFAKHIDADFKNGLLETGYSAPNKSKLLKIAQDVARVEGDLPIDLKEGDTLNVILRKAQEAKAEMERIAKHDPIAALAKEVSKMDRDFAKQMTEMQKTRNTEPLQFLYRPSALAIASADRILGSADFIIAAANKFNHDSPEFKALQQVYVARYFQRSFSRLGEMRAELAGETGKVSPVSSEEVQALMFPGTTKGQMEQLAKDMEFLFMHTGESFGGGMAATARVMNPTAHIPLPKLGMVGNLLVHTPVVSFAARLALQKVFSVTMDAVSHPNFINWLAGELRGNAAQRLVAKAALDNRLRLGGWLGAAAGQQVGQSAQQAAPSSMFDFQEPAEEQRAPALSAIR